MKRFEALLLAVLLCVGSFATLTITNISEWHIQTTQPPVKKIAGRDLGNPAYGVKSGRVYWSIEEGLNVTYVEVAVPRCHRATFSPVLNVSGSGVSVKLFAESVSGSYAGQLNASITIESNLQVEINRGTITRQTGTPVTISGQTSLSLQVSVGSGAPLGVEVARIYTWLYFNYSTAKARQNIVWIVKTLPTPPRLVLFYDGFEGGSLTGWTRTTYTYVEQKNYNVTVNETCYSDNVPTPQTITDVTRPFAGSWLAWVGFRNQVSCEPAPARNDYLRRSISVPSSIDGVEVKYVNVTFWWRFLTWDSANYDYIVLSLSKGTTTFYWKNSYNPNSGDNYGPFRDTGWQRNSTFFSGAAGSTITLNFLLHTFGDQYYRSWLYIDEVYVVAYFDCVSTNQDPSLDIARKVPESSFSVAFTPHTRQDNSSCVSCRGK